MAQHVAQREATEGMTMEAVEEAGVQIIRPDKSLFAQKTQELFEAYKDQGEKYELIQAIQDIE